MGGGNVVSSYVASLVNRFQTGGGTTRIAGTDRYHTAALLSAATFAPARSQIWRTVVW